MEKKYLNKLLLIGVLFLCYSLNTAAQKKTYLNPKDTMDLKYEKFDMDFYQKNKDERGNLLFNEKKENEFLLEVIGNEILDEIVVRKLYYPYYFTNIKKFSINGDLREKGITLGECKVGKWLECDKFGICNVIDYEKNRGRFGYNDVLLFLEKKKYINPKKGVGLGRFGVAYNYENSYWIVSGTHNETLWTVYHLDGNTGKILKEFQPPIVF